MSVKLTLAAVLALTVISVPGIVRAQVAAGTINVEVQDSSGALTVAAVGRAIDRRATTPPATVTAIPVRASVIGWNDPLEANGFPGRPRAAPIDAGVGPAAGPRPRPAASTGSLHQGHRVRA